MKMKRIISIFFCVLCISTIYAQRVAMSKDSPMKNFENGKQYIKEGNCSRGIGLIKLAAGKGIIDAELFLAEAYYDGIIVKKNNSEAGYWYQTAASNGSALAAEKLASMIEAKEYMPKVEATSSLSQPTQVIMYNPSNQAQDATVSHGSDVDINIPKINIENKGTIVIIIANEHYQEEANVDFANNDGEIFKEYCNQTLGIPSNQIHFRKDATLNNILSELNWLKNVTSTSEFRDSSNIIFYYAGHGIPDEATGTSYILPVDGVGNIVSTGYSLSSLYSFLSSLPIKRATVFMDACFSGSKRGNGMLMAARGVRIKAKPEKTSEKLIVFSAASGDETAYPYTEKKHGLFTYFLLKKLQDSNGNCSYEELKDYIYDNVTSKSVLENGKSQTPTVNTSTTMWTSYHLK